MPTNPNPIVTASGLFDTFPVWLPVPHGTRTLEFYATSETPSIISMMSLTHYAPSSSFTGSGGGGTSTSASWASSSISSSYSLSSSISISSSYSLSSSFSLSSSRSISSSYSLSSSRSITSGFSDTSTSSSYALTSSTSIRSSYTNNGPITGDVTGSLSSSMVVGLRGVQIDSTSPSVDNILVYSSSKWIPKDVNDLPINFNTNQPVSLFYHNPVGTISSGSNQYVANFMLDDTSPPDDGYAYIYRTDINTRQTTRVRVCDRYNQYLNFSLLKSDGGIPYVVWTTDEDRIYLLNINTQQATASYDITEFYPQYESDKYKIFKINDVSNPSKPVFYGISDNVNVVSISNIRVIKYYWDGSNYESVTTGSALNLTSNTIVSSSIFKQFEPTDTAANFIYVNIIKNPMRLYVKTYRSGLLHIFEIDSSFGTNFFSWWLSPSRLNFLTYKKSISVQDGDEYVSPLPSYNGSRYSLEYDLSTGEEIMLNYNNATSGKVTRMPWVE